MKRIVPTLLFAGILASVTSCSQSGSGLPSAVLPPYVPSADTIARVHWLGKERLGVAASASYFMRIWELPQSAKLQAQTLDKLSTFPWSLSAGETVVSNASGALRPLLDDVVWNESYLEVRHPANQPAEFAFAIRLKPARAGIWQTNLARVLESSLGVKPATSATDPQGWSLKPPGIPNLIRLIRTGEWTIITGAPDNTALFDGIMDWIHHDRLPAFGTGTNDWLEADLDLQQLAAVLPPAWHLNPDLPKIDLAINGDGANVLTHGQLTFPKPLHLELAPWAVPADLIPEPLDSFTAVRGLRPSLASLKIWHDLPLNTPPDQLYFWALPGAAPQVYFAAPYPDASQAVNRLTGYLITNSNPWLAAHGYVKFEPLPDTNGVVWGNTPSFQPFLKFADAGSAVYGGLSLDTNPGTNTQDNVFEHPSLSRLLDRISAQTNLVYYDWELSGSRIEPCLYLGQAARVVSHHAQLPLETAGLEWLRAIEPRFGPCTTMVTRTGANQLSFFRKSTVGFTGAELQLLADWLESPQFPFGLYSLQASPTVQP